MLTLAQQGSLIVFLLNRLHFPEDIEEGIAASCCPDCCAECWLLRELLDAGQLTTVVKQAPQWMWHDGMAWMKDGEIDEAWVRGNWGCTSSPKCDRVERDMMSPVEEETAGSPLPVPGT